MWMPNESDSESLRQAMNQESKKRTRRDTATPTSRPVEVIQRGFMLHLPFQRPLPLVGLRAL